MHFDILHLNSEIYLMIDIKGRELGLYILQFCISIRLMKHKRCIKDQVKNYLLLYARTIYIFNKVVLFTANLMRDLLSLKAFEILPKKKHLL